MKKVKLMKSKHKIKIIVALIPVVGSIIVTILSMRSYEPDLNRQTNIAGNDIVVSDTFNNTVNNSNFAHKF